MMKYHPINSLWRPLVVVAVLSIILPAAHAAGQGMMGGQQMMGQQRYQPQVNPGGVSCPNCGAYLPPNMMGYGQGMGPGMMGYGQGMGPGMMGYGQGMGPGMMGYGGGMYPGMMGYGYGGGMYPGMMGYGYGGGQGMMGPGMMGYYPQRAEPLLEADVRTMIQNHLQYFVRNPNLKLGSIADKGEAFEVSIVTKVGDGLVSVFLVDKKTGWMQPAP